LSEKPQKPVDFQPIDDPAEALTLLREAAKTLSAAMIWSKDQAQVVNTHLTLLSEVDKALYAWIPKDVNPAKFMDEVARTGTEDCFFSVSLQRASIFFKARFKGYDEGGLKFALPTQLYKVQRRKDLRFTVPEGHLLKVDFEDPLFPGTMASRRILDLSASGLAFLAGPDEAPQFATGLILKKVTVTVRGRPILTEAEVKHARPLPDLSPLKGSKVGILFKGMRAADVQHLASYVFEESRKFLSRFM
jgi:hypothetical protein